MQGTAGINHSTHLYGHQNTLYNYPYAGAPTFMRTYIHACRLLLLTLFWLGPYSLSSLCPCALIRLPKSASSRRPLRFFVYLLLSIPGHTARCCPMLFSSLSFSSLSVSWSSFLFLCHWISFLSFSLRSKYLHPFARPSFNFPL